MFSRILVAVDLDHAEQLTKALELAGQTAQNSGAEVIYANVVDAVPTTSKKTEGERLEQRLKDFVADQAAQYDIRTSHHVRLRSDLQLTVGPDLIKVAKDENCDLIIMASHVPGFKEHILASNAGYVASHAPMTVYVVR